MKVADSGCSKSSICEAPVKSGSEERVVLFMYVAVTSDEYNKADGLFQQPAR